MVILYFKMADQDAIAALKKRRAIVKNSCTRTRTYVNSIASVTPSIVAQLEERKSKLDNYWNEYNIIQTELEMLDEAEASDKPGFEEAFYELSARIREISKSAATLSVGERSSLTNNPSGSSDTLSHVRLPKLDLPAFSGRYDEWLPFYDTFHAIIHVNSHITNVQKLHYLRASLKGDASS